MGTDPYRYFRIEAAELLADFEAGLLELERGGSDRGPILAKLLRVTHTLKGAARVVKQAAIAELAHSAEGSLIPLRDAEAPPERALLDELFAKLDRMRAFLAALDRPAAAPQPPSEGREPRGQPSGRATEAREPGDREPSRREPSRREPGERDPREPPRPPLPRGEGAAVGASERAAEGLLVARADAQELDALGEAWEELRDGIGALRRPQELLGRARELLRALGRSTTGPGAALLDEALGLLGDCARTFDAALERSLRELGQAREIGERLRLVKVSLLAAPLGRVVRDVAYQLDRRVEFELRGGHVGLDAEVVLPIQRALVQAVRNAVVHGLEAPAERVARGKDAVARIVVTVERAGRFVRFTCRDDGRGIDWGAVRRRASELDGEAALAWDERRLMTRLWEGGLSTTSTPSEVAGRGVGLDLIREVADSLGARLELESTPGHGTTLLIEVPASLAALDVLVIELEQRHYAFPLERVIETARAEEHELVHELERPRVRVRDRSVEFVALGDALAEGGEASRKPTSLVVLRLDSGELALGVERIVGIESLLFRPVPPHSGAEPYIAGVAVDAQGTSRLLLDPSQLPKLDTLPRGTISEAPARPRPILVVDDSLTTRMLEQSILEAAGYTVETAASAEEGLEKARQGDYGLFLVDVEMPGMDGFGFVEAVVRDERLSATPAILVTSRNSPADRARGVAVGARGHIVKGEFDQRDFLARVKAHLR